MILLEKANAEKGKRLCRLRKEHGFSQAALADALGVTRQAVSIWERGASFPSMENLIKLSRLYQVELAVLTGEDEPQGLDEPEEPDKPDGEPPRREPAPFAGLKYILWPACLLIAIVVICATVLLLHAQLWETDRLNETEVMPIEEVNKSEIEFLPEGHVKFDPW